MNISLFRIGFVCLMAAACMCAPFEGLAGTRIVIPKIASDDTRQSYTLALIRLALDKTAAEYGECEVVQYEVFAGQTRSLRMVEEGRGIDLGWSMTSREREKAMLPIRIPIQKGLLGHRIFIIKPQMAEAFAQVKKLDDLKLFRAGQGHDWPDRTILQRNGLDVKPSSTYAGCFRMLEEERFDYFPRGVVEPWNELAHYKGGELVVEKTIMLRYPAPLYFFVNRANTLLANRLEKGLRAALADGSFDVLFYNHPSHRQAFAKSRLKERTVIDLVNPLLPDETPLDDKTLWVDLDKLP